MVCDDDNCVTLSEFADKGDAVCFLHGGRDVAVIARQCIPAWHKMAVCPVGEGLHVCKYGSVIGVALCDIDAGEHVHIHNIKSPEGERIALARESAGISGVEH